MSTQLRQNFSDDYFRFEQLAIKTIKTQTEISLSGLNGYYESRKQNEKQEILLV